MPSTSPSFRLGTATGGAILVLGPLALASIGQDQPTASVIATLLERVVFSALPAAAFVAGGVGLGRCWTPLWPAADERPRPTSAASALLGLATLLIVSHLLGMAGAFSRNRATALGLAWAPVAVGLVLLLRHAVRSTLRRGVRVDVPWMLLPGLVGVGVMIAAACNPPGWLWDSEFGGFDALSYHLALPQAWITEGLRPLPHNVYSYLPGFVEGSFLQLGSMIHAPSPGTPGSPTVPFGLAANDGRGAIACQLMSVGFAIVAAWACRDAAVAFAARLRDGRPSSLGAAPSHAVVAAAIVLTAPWLLVVGSLAYNDAAMLAFAAGALAVAADIDAPPVRRAVMTAVLIGAACGCKPTAIVFAGVPAAVTLLAWIHPRRWPLAVARGCLAGLATLLPWLVRNWLACGNPVFPYASSVFGSAHWSAEQVARFAAAHHYSGAWAERLRLLILPDAHDPAGPRHRGLLHPQWALAFPLTTAAALAGVAAAGRCRATLVLIASLLAQLAAWLTVTHLQSRFLLPMLVPASVLVALAPTMLSGTARRAAARCASVAVGVCVVAQACWAVYQFAAQRGGRPNQLLVAGPSVFSGELYRSDLAAMSPAERTRVGDALAPAAWVNLFVRPGVGLLLVGDATPFYFSALPTYATTWDSSPLARAIEAAPNDPNAWTRSLRGARLDLALVNLAEVGRYARSGTLDPRLSEDRVVAWLRSRPVVHAWPEAGVFLVSLEESPTIDPHATGPGAPQPDRR